MREIFSKDYFRWHAELNDSKYFWTWNHRLHRQIHNKAKKDQKNKDPTRNQDIHYIEWNKSIGPVQGSKLLHNAGTFLLFHPVVVGMIVWKYKSLQLLKTWYGCFFNYNHIFLNGTFKRCRIWMFYRGKGTSFLGTRVKT